MEIVSKPETINDSQTEQICTLFEKKVLAALGDYPEASVFLAAVSGGADSTAMLSALRDAGFLVYCMHIDHGLREESHLDAVFVRELCDKLQVECQVVSIKPGKILSYAKRKGTGIEAAARHFRYRALKRYAEELGGKTQILVAHTKDDLLELALMRVLRGCGPGGLSAMPVSRAMIRRPLLEISHAEVLQYLAVKNIDWREDATNRDISFLRNRIRHKLVPQLDTFFPEWKKGLTAMAQTQSLAAEFISNEARSINWETSSPHSLASGAEHFFSQARIIREEALFQGINILSKIMGKTDNFQPKRDVIRRFCNKQIRAADLGILRIYTGGGKINIDTQKLKSSESGFTLMINKPGLYNLNVSGINLEISKREEGISGDFYTNLPLLVRGVFNEDFLYHKGRKNFSTKGMFCAADAAGIRAFFNAHSLIPADNIFADDMYCVIKRSIYV
jgi:tRNA(Ile)-lysidine synthase